MAESNRPFSGAAAAGQQQQVRLHVNENKMATTYANAFRAHRLPDEMVLDFGMRIALPQQQQPEGQAPTADLLFDVTSRVVMNYAAAKRLAGALVQLIQQHEQQHGPIKSNEPQNPQPSGPAN